MFSSLFVVVVDVLVANVVAVINSVVVVGCYCISVPYPKLGRIQYYQCS